MKTFFRFTSVAAAAAGAFAAALLGAGAANAAPGACASSPFPVGSDLPEPGPTQRIAHIFSLRSADGSVRVGRIYLATSGATYYLSEIDGAGPKAIALEMGYLEAAGYSAALARQYTHLAEMPAVPPVAHALALAKRRGLLAIACN